MNPESIDNQLSAIANPLFEWREGVPYFRGLRVEQSVISLHGHTFHIAALHDAADLLDDPEYAQKFVDEDRAPYGMELWPGAMMLSDYLLGDEPGDSRPALELGCGVALVSLAAKCRGWHITASDYDDMALSFARRNAVESGITIDSYEHLDWNHPPKDRAYERVFGADVLYQKIDHEPVLAATAALLSPSGVGLFADPNRQVANRIPELAVSRGFQVEVLTTKGLNPSTGKTVDGRIFKLRRN